MKQEGKDEEKWRKYDEKSNMRERVKSERQRRRAGRRAKNKHA